MNKMLPLIVSFFFILSACQRDEAIIRRETCFNNGWKFLRSDAAGAEQVGFDDSEWRRVDLPHDYSIEDLPEKDGVVQVGPFSGESAGGISTGHVKGGTAWYRKRFTLEKADEGKIIYLLFDGVYMNANVWINGHQVGYHPYGYTAFACELTPYLYPAGKENVVAVQVQNEGENSRWYSGSGIYRNVSLVRIAPVHVGLWGVFVTTRSVTEEKARLNVNVSLENDDSLERTINLMMEVVDPDGQVVSAVGEAQKLQAGEKLTYTREVTVPACRLWSVENPELYTLVVRLSAGKQLVDEVRQSFGIRTMTFTTEKGFLLNGKPVLLKGGCLHHDNGILGAAAFNRAEFRKVEIMKKNGFNAIRTAHNPPSKAFLDACDQLGILVMEEAFDMWQEPKKPDDYHLYFDNWWEKDLEAMVLRDRNHPSVIIWSIGNEIKERADSSGLEIARKLKERIAELDSTRPVTQGICSFWETPGRPWEDSAPAFAQMDVQGYNYMWKRYESDHKKYPGRIIIGTESFPMEAQESWQQVQKHAYVIGDFVWTGMDYLGESGIGSTKLDNDTLSFLPPWPWFNAYCGDISLLGYKKPQSFCRDVVWHHSDLEVLVHAPVPEGRNEIISKWGWPDERKSWTWQGHEGKLLEVTVYSRCEEVRLELNGTEVGRQPVTEATRLRARFEVPYAAGTLTAIGLRNGKEVVRQVLKTTGRPAQLQLTAERPAVPADLGELAYFKVEVCDAEGRLVPDAAVPVEFRIEGVGNLQAVGNGNPTDMKSFQQPHVTTFRGRCQLVVRSTGKKGVITVTAASDGLTAGTATIRAR